VLVRFRAVAVAHGVPEVQRPSRSLNVSTVYTQHTVTSISVGPTGHVHNRAQTDPADASPTAIDCDACGPFLIKEGWTHDPESVPLTDRQERDKERVERDGNLAVKQVAEALAERAAEALVTGGAPRAAVKRTPKKTG
jgi:hypothetical protein